MGNSPYLKKKKEGSRNPKSRPPFCHLTNHFPPISFSLSLSPPRSPSFSFFLLLSLFHDLPEISSVGDSRADTCRSSRSRASRNAGLWFPCSKIAVVDDGTLPLWRAAATVTVQPPQATFDGGSWLHEVSFDPKIVIVPLIHEESGRISKHAFRDRLSKLWLWIWAKRGLIFK